METGFIAACLSRGRTVLLILVLIFLAGTHAYLTIPKEAQPDITIPVVYVSMTHEGISPEDAERMLIRPMEKELRGIDGVKEIKATARQGSASVTLEFQAGMDIKQALNDVRERVDIAKAELPDETDEPIVNEINLALEPVIIISLSGNIPERQLIRTAKQLRDAIEAIPEVLEVDIGGEREEVVELVIDPRILETYMLELDVMAQMARRNNVLIAAGDLDSGTGRIPVKVPGLFETPEDILNLPLKTDGDRVLRVRDIATVLPTFKDAFGYAREGGVPALTLYVRKRVGQNVIATVDKVRQVVEENRAQWPAGLQISYSQDASKYIREMLTDLQNNMISAVVLVMVVCIAALGWRSGMLVGIAIPGSFLAGILVLHLMGLTINIVVLFSLILAVGMLVDGAIVVTEFADRKMTEGVPRAKAYRMASQRMAWPIIASTATTLAAFMPLLFWPGITGEFMKFLPITLIATLAASLLMALVFVPTLGALFGRPGPANHATMRSLAAAEGGDLTEIEGFTGWYVRLLDRLLKHPWKVLLCAIASFVGAQLAYQSFGRGVEFFPDVDPDFASIIVRMRGNLSIEEMDALVRQVEDRILPVQGIRAVVARTRLSFRGQGLAEDTHGLIQLEFADWQERRPARQILREIALRTEGIPGIEVEPMDPAPGALVTIGVHAVTPHSGVRARNGTRAVRERVELLAPGFPTEYEMLPAAAAGSGNPNGLEGLVGKIHLRPPVHNDRDGNGHSRPAIEAEALLADLRPLVRGVPGVLVEQRALEAGPPTGKDIQIEISSHHPAQIEAAVEFLRLHMEEMPGLRDIDDTRPIPEVEWQVRVNRTQASRYGADIRLVGSAVQFITNGLMLGSYRPDGADDEIDIRARFPSELRHLGQLEGLRVNTRHGPVPISHFVESGPALKVGKIERVGGRRVLSVTANVEDGILTDTKARELREWQSGIAMPDGLMVRFRGQDEEQQESTEFLLRAFVVAVFIMAIILVTQFNSIYQTFLILTAVLFSTVGVFLGLLLTHQPFGVVMNGIGIIALAGIVVNNNIVLIDTFNHHHRENQLPLQEAILRTCAQRLRPVILTTITTALGLVPMVFKLNIDFLSRTVAYNAPSTQWWTQLATSVAFGVLFATLLTLILTPSLLVIGHSFRRRRRAEA